MALIKNSNMFPEYRKQQKSLDFTTQLRGLTDVLTQFRETHTSPIFFDKIEALIANFVNNKLPMRDIKAFQ